MGKRRESIENWKTPNELNVDKGTIIPPSEGWESQSWYAVDVSFSNGNPVHEGVYYTGFLQTGSYAFVITSDGQTYRPQEVYYMKGIRKLKVKE